MFEDFNLLGQEENTGVFILVQSMLAEISRERADLRLWICACLA